MSRKRVSRRNPFSVRYSRDLVLAIAPKDLSVDIVIIVIVNANKNMVSFLNKYKFKIMKIKVSQKKGSSNEVNPQLKDRLFWFLCGNEVYTDTFFRKIALKVLPDKHFTIP
jgi:hypothetical protein